MYVSTALQEELLDELANEKIPVTIYLMNGFQIRGIVADHDDAVVVVVAEEKQQIVYKHAISTIIPYRPLKALKEK